MIIDRIREAKAKVFEREWLSWAVAELEARRQETKTVNGGRWE